MTPNERKTMEAVIALLETYPAAPKLQAHRWRLQDALDADPAPRECDPYAVRPWPSHPMVPPYPQQYDADGPRAFDPYPVCGVDAGTRQRDVSSMQRILEDYKPADPDELASPKIFLVERGALVSIIHRSDPQQYDADPPQEPGRETLEAPK